jgi:hypothetical protein
LSSHKCSATTLPETAVGLVPIAFVSKATELTDMTEQQRIQYSPLKKSSLLLEATSTKLQRKELKVEYDVRI